MVSDLVYQRIDEKIKEIESQGKSAAIIVIADKLFRQMQQDMIQQDLMQVHGRIRSPYDLQVYHGIKVVASQVVESCEVY